MFDQSTVSEQDCIRDAISESPAEALEQPVTDDYWFEGLFTCLYPATARDIYLSTFLAELGKDGWDLNEGQVSCLREATGEIDVAAVVANDPDVGEEIMGAILECAPNPLIYSMVEGFGVERGDLSED